VISVAGQRDSDEADDPDHLEGSREDSMVLRWEVFDEIRGKPAPHIRVHVDDDRVNPGGREPERRVLLTLWHGIKMRSVPVPDRDIPVDAWKRARCVAVIPSIKKAAFIGGVSPEG